MADGVEVKECHLYKARVATMFQLEANGLRDRYKDDQELIAFVNEVIEVRAADMAYIDMLQKALNDRDFPDRE